MGMKLPMWSDRLLYQSVSPLGTPSYKVAPISPRPGSLVGKKIGLVWNGFDCGDVILEAFADLLAKLIAGTEFIKLPSGRNEPWGTEAHEGTTGVLAEEAGLDAVIVAAGG